MAMLAIPNQSMYVSLGDARVRALVVRTGKALCVYPLRCSPSAFHLTPGTYKRRCGPHNRRAGGGEATDRAITWRAWLEEALKRGVPRCFTQLGRTLMAPVKVPKPHQR